MTIKECIDNVDNIKPNQYGTEIKVKWLSFIDEIIINDVLKTHEGYDGRYDDFMGYSADKLSTPLIVPSPYDRLYPAYLKMRIDGENGETARYNNSAALFNTYMMEYRKYYNKTHLPLSTPHKTPNPPKSNNLSVSDAQLEYLKRELYHVLSNDVGKALSDDKLYSIVTNYVSNNAQMLKGKDGKDGINGRDGIDGKDGKDGYTPRKNIDYFDGKDGAKGDKGDSYILTEADKTEISGKVPTHEKYFDITPDGKISLKPEYRGAAGKKYYSDDAGGRDPNSIPYCISDNGIGNVGSKNHELPREISIPLTVNGVTVTGCQNGIFAHNARITQVTLNPNFTTIPSAFLHRAINCAAIHCTEQITAVKTDSLSQTKLKKLEMPNLETASGQVFQLCSQLEYVDMGKITALGNTVFDSCYKLKEIKIANPVTTIGNYTFHNCFNLRTIDNIVAPNITTSIGQDAFLMCKATYDWDKLVGCTFGQYATSNQSHTTRFWEGVNFTPCENRAKSFLNQLDTRWVDVPLVEGHNRTFDTSCVPLSTMGVYCSLNNIDVDDARDFPRICALNGTNITEVDGDYDLDNDADDFYAKMGLEVEYIEAPWNADKLATLYQALAGGKYAVLVVPAGVGVYKGHALAVTGISPFGELLIQDPGNQAYLLGIPENASGKVPIQNLINTAGNHWSNGTKVAQILSKKAVT